MIEPNDLELYELFCRLMDRAGDEGKQKLVIYQPELFIEMAREIKQLRAENKRLHVDQSKYAEQAQWNLRLVGNLQLIKRELKRRDIHINGVDWR